MSRPTGTTICIVLIFLQLAGCAHICQRTACAPAPVVPGAAFVPAPVLPNPAPPPQVPQVPLNPAPPAPDVRLYPPEWRPLPDSSAPTGEPPRAGGESPQPSVRLLPPEAGPSPPAPGENRSTGPPLPVGIPEFAQAKDQVASGLKPLLDGLDWLQANGYRTVLHLRSPGQDESADRREVEKRGLRYLSLEVSPQDLSRTLLAEFNRLVGDGSRHPLFVYDRDGRLAGGLWYLHFRTVEKAGDELARAKARRLGLREDGDPEQRTLWLAIQKLLSELANGT